MALLILATLAAYRLSTDFAWMDGPAGVYAKVRGRAVARGWDGATCPICISFWLALPAALVVAPLDWTLILYWLGIAGAVAFLVRWAGGAA